MFERFTERARQVVVLSQDESRSLGHDYIGTEHLLLGLLREEEGLAARALESLSISLDEAREQVARIVGRGVGGESGQIPFTPRAKKVLELSLREAMSLGHNHIGTEHVLLGLVRENDGVAARILLDLGADDEMIRSRVISMLSGPGRGTVERMSAEHPRPGIRGPSWEYRLERVATAAGLSAEWLNELGAEGWELAGITPDGADLSLVFKRRRF